MDQLTNALEKVKEQMTNPNEETTMATAAPKKKAPTKRVKPAAAADETAAPKKKAVANGEAKPAKVKPAKPASDENMVTLVELCKELKLEPQVARRYLRKDEIPNPGRWAWPRGSKELEVARKCLSE